MNEINEINEFGKALHKWWESDTYKQLRDATQNSIESSVGWYHMLSDEDRYKAVESICHIIISAEKKGISHRGLMSELNLYPEAFWINSLMDLHNAVHKEFNSQNIE